MKVARIITGIVAGVLLVGCGAETPGKADDKTEAAPAKDQRYGSLTALRDAAKKTGYDCPTWTADNKVENAAESGSCSDADVFSTYSTAEDLQTALENFRSISATFAEMVGKPSETLILVGPNWIINSPDAVELQADLGGTIER